MLQLSAGSGLAQREVFIRMVRLETFNCGDLLARVFKWHTIDTWSFDV